MGPIREIAVITADAIVKIAPAARLYAGELVRQELSEVLAYDPETGEIRWRVDCGPSATAGQLAGTTDKDGYRVIQYRRKLYKAHRLAWLLCHGTWPAGQIDHRNGVRSDNRISNLRVAVGGQNNQNIATYKSNTTGFCGVVWHKRQRKFLATIKKDRVSYHLGCFDTAEEAAEAYRAAKARLHEFQPVSRAA
jgi:hypothetical protein